MSVPLHWLFGYPCLFFFFFFFWSVMLFLLYFCQLQDMLCSFFSIIGYTCFFKCMYQLKFLIMWLMEVSFWYRDPFKGLFCYAQGYSTHFFCVASFLWTTTIAFTLHRTVVKHKTDVEDLEAMFHLYVWGMQLCINQLLISFVLRNSLVCHNLHIL